MKLRIKILWNLLCRPNATFSRRIYETAEQMNSEVLPAVTDASQENEFRVIFNLLPLMIWFKDTEDCILRVNQRAADVAGLAIQDIEGKYSKEIFPNDSQHSRADDLEVIRSGKSKLGLVEMLRDSRGKNIWAQTDKVPVRDPDGRIIGIVVISKDVSERKLAEEALRESEQKFRLLADNLTDAFWIRSADMKILHYLSPGYERIWGRPIAGLQSSPHEWTDSIVPEDRKRIRAVFATLRGEAPRVSAEYRIFRPDGEIRWIHARGFQVRDAAGKLVRLTGIVTDITERRKTEESRRELAAMLESAQRIGRMGSWCIHVRAKRLVWSDATCELFGITPEEFEGTFEFFSSFIVEEGRPAYAAKHALISPSNRIWEAEYRIRWRDGTLRWMYERGVADFDDTGAGVTRTGMVMDVTERKIAEEKLRESRDSLRLLNSAVEQLKESILITDAELDQPGPTILFVNQAFTAMTGYTAEEAIGKTPRMLQGPLTDRATIARLRRNLSSGEMFEGETVNYRKDGTAFHLEWQTSPLRNASGITTHYVAIQRDVTERKQAEEELRWKTALLEAQVDSYDVGILVVDSNGRKILQNRRMMDLWQIPSEIAESDDDNAQLQFIRSRTTSPEQFLEKVNYLYANPDERSADEIGLSDGTVLDRYSAPVIGKDGRHYGRIWSFADITARKQAETDRIALNQQLVAVSRQAGMAEVATNVLHNVGNVLNSVNISCAVISEKVRKSQIDSVAKTADLLQRHQADLAAFFSTDPAGRKLTEYLGKLAERLSQEQAMIITELQSLSSNVDHIKDIVIMQQSYARVSGVTEMVPVEDLIEDALRLCAEALVRHHVRVVREYAKTPPVFIEKHKVLQILVNLISNAKSACAESGCSDKVITLRFTAERGTFRIAVIDNGVGIPSANLTCIFSHGFTTKANGHGFGLHGSVLAAREMGGDLQVHSAGSGSGTTFTLILPVSLPQPTMKSC